MKRKAYSLAILLFLLPGAVAFAFVGAAIACTGMLKAAFDLWVTDDTD